ncbi:hypothetical protein D3C80_1953890 [compost metagenome]
MASVDITQINYVATGAQQRTVKGHSLGFDRPGSAQQNRVEQAFGILGRCRYAQADGFGLAGPAGIADDADYYGGDGMSAILIDIARVGASHSRKRQQ